MWQVWAKLYGSFGCVEWFYMVVWNGSIWLGGMSRWDWMEWVVVFGLMGR